MRFWATRSNITRNGSLLIHWIRFKKEGTRKQQSIPAEQEQKKPRHKLKYTEVDKQVKESIRTNKRKYVEDLAMTVKKAAREGNMKQLYDTTKKLAGNYRKPGRPVESKDGKVITNIEEQRNRWVEHFKELLNRPAPLNSPNIAAATTDLPINVGPPTIQE
ncbi:unnamed protein product [Schistosoma margrebowiei]|uniref:Uncharacterized protein n=1 Tax=Schistosoma margrebowiei TaxID=48269 RepID=A0A183LEY0_9TREM|nr:unnamed protein product [Schistosoma margrebowiei]